ncbi:MAG: hypothetical protein Q7T03_00365, partial [Deltaproteobacteria bacterium]|nr:hypothetical protein [Deltaproteobacteria bacterium]
MKTLFTLCFLMVIPPGLHAQALKPQDQAPTVELEIEFFHDCTPGDEGLVCKIPEEAATPTALKSLDQFQKPVSVGWIPALGVFIVVDQESEVTVGKAATSALPSPKPIAFYKLNTDKTALLPTDVQTEIKNVQSQVTTAAITP